jgi:hypothetical protein
VFVADITDNFILGPDILRAYDASVDIRRCVLRLGRDEVPVRDGAYGVGVEVDATYREPQEWAAGVLAMREDRSPLERVSSGTC